MSCASPPVKPHFSISELSISVDDRDEGSYEIVKGNVKLKSLFVGTYW